MSYAHRFLESGPSSIAVGKVVCIGKNYRAEPDEPVNTADDIPVLFFKPACALVPVAKQIKVPDYSPCYYEVELAILIGSKLHRADENNVKQGIAGYAVALDLTLKELLDDLKQKDRPWEMAKAFEGACPISPFVRPDRLSHPIDTNIQLSINGQVRQKASTGLMIRNPFELVSLISQYFTLYPGDVVLTGTPAGGGLLPYEASLTITLNDCYEFQTTVQAVSRG
jgi:2-keto-4-pentenoate hydratase/2-oxohepta-3-ene-1,7-dioic acid hydratase in catechol pathway